MTRRIELAKDSSLRDVRCVCTRLLAKWRAGGLEVKCKYCKKIVVIPFSDIEGWEALENARILS